MEEKRGPKILLIESESQDLDHLLKLLGRFHCRVDILNGQMAPPAWKDFQPDQLPDILLLDLHASNALRMLREMRSVNLSQEIPAVILANSVVEKHVLDSFGFERCTCAVKPLSYVKLLYAFTTLGMNLPSFKSFEAPGSGSE